MTNYKDATTLIVHRQQRPYGENVHTLIAPLMHLCCLPRAETVAMGVRQGVVGTFHETGLFEDTLDI